MDADGMVTEGAATNAWIVDSAGVLRTRPADGGILNGIVRQTIIGLLDELRLTFEERSFSVEEALLARECFSTASTLAVFPVVNIDGQNIGDGKPGPVARQIVNRYDRHSLIEI